ncbi:hypothetical protein Catovirus_1_635 [Catovirus CTV1]|uniref:Uncharacterized protein n=1 Tax=Catovirus CTV1 TaxID=1977631 RepID=A0A1V0SA42_9VIRU|nr:hypothetical protein Catovirus_1_635 [Catovirus CTV1]
MTRIHVPSEIDLNDYKEEEIMYKAIFLERKNTLVESILNCLLLPVDNNYDLKYSGSLGSFNPRKNKDRILIQEIKLKNSLRINIVYVEIDPIKHINYRVDLDFCKSIVKEVLK